MKRKAGETHSVESFLHEVQQHVDCVHINTHVLSGALLYFWCQEYVQAGKGQVPQQVDHMTEGKTGWGLESPRAGKRAGGGRCSRPVELLRALVPVCVDHQTVSQNGCQSSELCCLFL